MPQIVRPSYLTPSHKVRPPINLMGSIEAPRRRCNVAIIGGGIGGLALAIGLLRRKVQVQIYEAASSFEEVGLGLSIGPAAHRAMPLIDPHIREAYDKLVTTHADSPGYEHLRETWFEIVWATKDRNGELLMDLKAPPSGQTTVRRADFQDALVNLVPEEIRHFGKRLDSLIDDDDRMTISFEDGTTATADIVIGCDGIKSKVKEYIIPETYGKAQPQYSGMYAYRTVLDMETMIAAVGERRARVSTLYVGNGVYGITYPIMRAKKVNVGLYKLNLNDEWKSDKWTIPAPKTKMFEDFANTGENIHTLMKCLKDSDQWAVFEHPPIPTYTRSRVTILGDAAHASTPHQGAGAGQAIEDAHVLAELLGDPNVTKTAHFEAALKAYDEVRRPRSQEVVASSKENGDVLCLCKDGVGDDGDKLKENLSKRFSWLWDLDVAGQAEKAREIMMRLMAEGEDPGSHA